MNRHRKLLLLLMAGCTQSSTLELREVTATRSADDFIGVSASVTCVGEGLPSCDAAGTYCVSVQWFDFGPTPDLADAGSGGLGHFPLDGGFPQAQAFADVCGERVLKLGENDSLVARSPVALPASATARIVATLRAEALAPTDGAAESQTRSIASP